MKLTNTRVVGACIIVCASIVSTSSSFADTETLSACVKKSNGATRIISGKMKCAKTERLVTWTSTSDSLIGPAGATGAIGAAGSPGAKGERGLTGPVGLTGAAGVNGLNGSNGRDGVDGTNGVDGINGTNGIDGVQGPQGEQGLTGATGATGPSGISKALVASGNQVSINQGSEATVLSATIPAGKYVMSLSASLNYSNGNTSMLGNSNLSCYLTTASSFIDAASDTSTVIWPELNNGTPFRISFESHAATSDEVMRRVFSGDSSLSFDSPTSIKWVCRHSSSVADDPNEQVIIRYPRLILTAVDQLVTLN